MAMSVRPMSTPQKCGGSSEHAGVPVGSTSHAVAFFRWNASGQTNGPDPLSERLQPSRDTMPGGTPHHGIPCSRIPCRSRYRCGRRYLHRSAVALPQRSTSRDVPLGQANADGALHRTAGGLWFGHERARAVGEKGEWGGWAVGRVGGLWVVGSCPPVMPGMAVKAMTAVPAQYTSESPTIVLYLPRKGKNVHTAACKRYRSFVKTRRARPTKFAWRRPRGAGARIQRCQRTCQSRSPTRSRLPAGRDSKKR